MPKAEAQACQGQAGKGEAFYLAISDYTREMHSKAILKV